MSTHILFTSLLASSRALCTHALCMCVLVKEDAMDAKHDTKAYSLPTVLKKLDKCNVYIVYLSCISKLSRYISYQRCLDKKNLYTRASRTRI